MSKLSRIGLDLAKQVFHLVGYDEQGNEILRRKLRRGQLERFFAQLTPCTVGMEACATAHYWGRLFQAQGHKVRLLPTRAVRAYQHKAKNDHNDARAIAEALRCPTIHAVPVKSLFQQDLQSLHRLRQGLVRRRTAQANRLRGLLAEYGIILPKGLAVLRRRLPEILADADNHLSGVMREALAEEYALLRTLDEQLERQTRRLLALSRQHPAWHRLQAVPGMGPISASAFIARIHAPGTYCRGRDVSAALGLVPGQYTTGGKPRLLGITKRGDAYLRTLLIHGARAAVLHAHRHEDPLSRWVVRLKARRGVHKATVALANKLARIGWALLAHGEAYCPAKAA